jgi:hypothetical protein
MKGVVNDGMVQGVGTVGKVYLCCKLTLDTRCGRVCIVFSHISVGLPGAKTLRYLRAILFIFPWIRPSTQLTGFTRPTVGKAK